MTKCCAHVVILLLSLTPNMAHADSSAEVISVQGQGQIRSASDTTWKSAQVRQKLYSGDSARTGDASRMAIMFSDQTQLRMSQNTQMRIGNIGSTQNQVTLIKLEAGRSWVQSKAIPDHLIMETPAAIASIRGTDWEMEVDKDGRSRLTVLHGRVEFSNDQGQVSVGSNEQAIAEKGKAPVKLLLLNPSERVQWVTSYPVDLRKYPEMMDSALVAGDERHKVLSSVKELINEGKYHEARLLLREEAQSLRLDSPIAFLLLADFAVYAGDLAAAETTLLQAKTRFLEDTRLDAQLVRVALYRDDITLANRLLRNALEKNPDAIELKLAEGEIARFAGQERQATSAYSAVTRLAPVDPRGWLGLGLIESEKENIKQARRLLDRVVELADEMPVVRGELGTLESRANNWTGAIQHFDRALTSQPDDYVSLTGLGLFQLKRGKTEEALDTLLRASLIEPKYARAVMYAAVAYYQLGRSGLALETLGRTYELDPFDPLPHQLAALIYTDLMEPGRAVRESREAMRLMPYLKSLNQLANDQKGAANLGNALAQFGLQDWALNFAQESYSPFWAGSHLFLADRYSGDFAKQSELMQGYLTDPTAFGASNRFQTLLQKPGHFLSAGGVASYGKDLHSNLPSVIANGYLNESIPIAYFLEGIRTNLVSSGGATNVASVNNVTAALGSLPREDVGVFAFVNDFDATVSAKSTATPLNNTSGRERTVTLGGNFKYSPTSQSWLKLGLNDESANVFSIDNRNINSSFDFRPFEKDIQFRHSTLVGDSEWSVGVESGANSTNTLNVLWSGGGIGKLVSSRIVKQVNEDDRSWSVYLADRHRLSESLMLDAGLFMDSYAKSSNSLTTLYQGQFSIPNEMHVAFGQKAIHPRIGLVYRPRQGEVWRLVSQKWTRPVTANSLSSVATAGIPLDDQVVLPGGEFKRVRLQLEKEWSGRAFGSVFLDAKQVFNLGQPGNVLNQNSQIADLDRLRIRSALVFQNNAEDVELPPIFLQGRIGTAGLNLNLQVNDNLSMYANYVSTSSRNASAWFSGLALPYMPRHHVTLGASWVAAPRFLVQPVMIYRSQRFADENNVTGIPASWAAAIKAGWQSIDKAWLVEAYVMNMLNRNSSATAGLNIVWRY